MSKDPTPESNIRPLELIKDGRHHPAVDSDSNLSTRWKWRSKINSSAQVRQELVWLYNEYKRGFLEWRDGKVTGIRKLTPEDLRVMTGVLSRTNEVLRDAITEGKLKELEMVLRKLEEGKELTPTELQKIVGAKGAPDKELDDDPMADLSEGEEEQ